MYRKTVAASSANRQRHICCSWHAGRGGTPVLAGSAIPGIGGSWNRFAIKGIRPCTSPARQATAGVALHVLSLRHCRQAGLMIFPPGEMANVRVPPSDVPVALATAVLTVSSPPFANDCPLARLTMAVSFAAL